jgi:hypothetical protein
MDNPPPYDGPWPNEKELILEKAEAILLSKPTKPIPIKAVCVFHLTQPAHTDPQTGITHPIKIVKIKRATLTFDSNTTLAQFFELARATFARLFPPSRPPSTRRSSRPPGRDSSGMPRG